jgi:hypothetical protein
MVSVHTAYAVFNVNGTISNGTYHSIISNDTSPIFNSNTNLLNTSINSSIPPTTTASPAVLSSMGQPTTTPDEALTTATSLASQPTASPSPQGGSDATIYVVALGIIVVAAAGVYFLFFRNK